MNYYYLIILLVNYKKSHLKLSCIYKINKSHTKKKEWIEIYTPKI